MLRPISGAKSGFQIQIIRADRRSLQSAAERSELTAIFKRPRVCVVSYFFPLVINKRFDWFMGTCDAPLTTALII